MTNNRWQGRLLIMGGWRGQSGIQRGDRRLSTRGRAAIGLSLVLVVGAMGALVANIEPVPTAPALKVPAPISNHVKPERCSPDSLDELLAMTPEQLSDVDIALMNLICAQGLPGSAGLDPAKNLETLDIWAMRVKLETERYYPRFLANPAQNNNSEADFRMLTLVTVVCLDLGVNYNKDRILKPDFSNAKDQFIHGMVGSDNGGTCASMPVLYTAIARRLGYPVYLVQARGHLFCRWDGRGERLNIDCTGNGLHTDTDSHYQEWPWPIADEEVARGEYLANIKPHEELALFMACRGHCFYDHKQWGEA